LIIVVAIPKPNNPQSLGFWARMLQVHLCLIFFISGLAKFLGNGGCDGANLGSSLSRLPFNLVPPDLGCILVMHAAIGLMMGLFLFAPVMIVMNLAGIWRSHYGQESTGDFGNYRAIKIHTKATGFGPDEAAVLKS